MESKFARLETTIAECKRKTTIMMMAAENATEEMIMALRERQNSKIEEPKQKQHGERKLQVK